MADQVQEVIDRCALACGAEAESKGFPQQAGYDIYQGCIADDLDGWTEGVFLLWIRQIEQRYSQFGDTKKLQDLYLAVCQIMGNYAPLLKSVADKD